MGGKEGCRGAKRRVLMGNGRAYGGKERTNRGERTEGRVAIFKVHQVYCYCCGGRQGESNQIVSPPSPKARGKILFSVCCDSVYISLTSFLVLPFPL
jgi:hypothetical protein